MIVKKIKNEALLTLRFFSNLRIEYIFLIIASLGGLYFAFYTPPIAVVDEENHFFRALEVSKGNMYTDKVGSTQGAYGANLPENMVYYVYNNKGVALNLPSPSKDIIKDLATQKPDSSKLREVVYNGSAVYSPVGYIPQATGMFIARVANLNIEMYLYMGRLLNLLMFILLTFFAIKLVPIGKSVIFAAALLPMTLYQAASLSADAIVMSSIFLLFSLSVLLIYKNRLPGKKLLLLILLTAGIVALTKDVYLVLVMPVLIYWVATIAKKDRLQALTVVGAVILFSIAMILLWSSRLSPEVTNGLTALVSGTEKISVSSQIMYVLSHPINYIKSVIDLFFFNPTWSDVSIRGIIGRYGWLGAEHFTPIISMMLGYVVIFISMFIDRQERLKKDIWASNNVRIVYAALFIVSSLVAILGVVTAMYLVFTPVGYDIIRGVQGRYFIPVIPVFMFGLVLLNPWIFDRINILRARQVLYVMVIANIVYAIITIMGVFV